MDPSEIASTVVSSLSPYLVEAGKEPQLEKKQKGWRRSWGARGQALRMGESKDDDPLGQCCSR